MKNISAALQDHLGGETTTLATLVKIIRTDGVVKAFTTCDQNLTVDGVTYLADGAFAPTAMDSTSNLATDHLDIAGVLSSNAIDGTDLAAGLYDGAVVELALCNWADTSMGRIKLRRGWLGEVERHGNNYVAELRGLHDLLQRPLGRFVTAECAHNLGDSLCGVALAPLTVTGSVTAVTSNSIFTDTVRMEATGWFDYGQVTWLTGANAGRSMEVKAWDALTQNITLWLPMPRPVMVGDSYRLVPGCDKRFSTCKNKFSNVTNFGGFPYVPGVGNILKYPDNR